MTAPNVCKDEARGKGEREREREGEKKKKDGSKFQTSKYIKVTPVNLASKQRNGNCSFLQQALDSGYGLIAEPGKGPGE